MMVSQRFSLKWEIFWIQRGGWKENGKVMAPRKYLLNCRVICFVLFARLLPSPSLIYWDIICKKYAIPKSIAQWIFRRGNGCTSTYIKEPGPQSSPLGLLSSCYPQRITIVLTFIIIGQFRSFVTLYLWQPTIFLWLLFHSIRRNTSTWLCVIIVHSHCCMVLYYVNKPQFIFHSTVDGYWVVSSFGLLQTMAFGKHICTHLY